MEKWAEADPKMPAVAFPKPSLSVRTKSSSCPWRAVIAHWNKANISLRMTRYQDRAIPCQRHHCIDGKCGRHGHDNSVRQPVPCPGSNARAR